MDEGRRKARVRPMVVGSPPQPDSQGWWGSRQASLDSACCCCCLATHMRQAARLCMVAPLPTSHHSFLGLAAPLGQASRPQSSPPFDSNTLFSCRAAAYLPPSLPGRVGRRQAPLFPCSASLVMPASWWRCFWLAISEFLLPPWLSKKVRNSSPSPMFRPWC